MIRTQTRSRTIKALVRVAVAAGLVLSATFPLAQSGGRVGSSLLLLVDASGSMGNPVGGGNAQAKIEAAKHAATAALGRAARTGSVEVAVLAFSGDCANPVPRYQDFTRDVGQLTDFINSLQPGGGTPMADALRFANRFMDRNGHPGAADRMIMLLADGHNDCGDVRQALAALKASGLIFRHETVGFGIAPDSAAAQDLREVATQTGGAYHHAADAAQLADVFMEFVDTFSVIDLLGRFGRAAESPPLPEPPDTGGPPQSDEGSLTGLLGSFRVPDDDAPKPPPAVHGATGDKDHYLAVATSPPAGAPIEPSGSGYFGIGWHTESHHDAGMQAVEACRLQGGTNCLFNASGTSLRGGCVGLAMAAWRDRDMDSERTYVVTSSSFRNLIAGDLRSRCGTAALSGKPAGTVVERSCEIVRIMCAGDIPLAAVRALSFEPPESRTAPDAHARSHAHDSRT